MMLSERMQRRIRHGLLAALIGAACTGAVLWSGLLESFEARVYDWQVRLLAATPPPGKHERPNIRVILLDQASLDWAARENGLSWPWPRELYGIVADFCQRAQAKTLAFDVLYTEPSKYGVRDDRLFGRSGERFGAFVLPVFVGRETGDATAWPDYAPVPRVPLPDLAQWRQGFPLRGLTFPKASFPIPELASRAKVLGNVHQEPDSDGMYRHIGLFTVFDGRPVPSLALAAYVAAHPNTRIGLNDAGLILDGSPVPLGAQGHATVRYQQPEAIYATVSAAAIIQSELRLREGQPPVIDPATFKDAYVFFGFSAPGLFDLRPVPLTAVYSGVEIHAQTLANILQGSFLHPLHPGMAFALGILLAGGAGFACALGASTLAALLTTGLCAPLPALLGIGLYLVGYTSPVLAWSAAWISAVGAAVMIGYATEGKQRRFIKSAFKQYVSPEVIEQLLRQPERMRLGGERRTLSIFFSDLQGFTSLSERLDPEALTQLLNDYLSAMTDIILEEGGTVDKYEGDAIIAFWNAPLDVPDHATRAVRTALRCQDELARLRPVFLAQSGCELHMRIGLNTGPAVVGNMGSHARFDYTMLGDAVNLAARLEGANKAFGTYTMISQAVLDATDDSFAARELAKLVVVGRAESVTVLEPMWPQARAERAEHLDIFERALAFFYARHFAAAEELFSSIAEIDPAARSYARQAKSYREQPPAPDWAGQWTLGSK